MNTPRSSRFVKSVSFVTCACFLYTAVFSQAVHAVADRRDEAVRARAALEETVIPSSCGRVTDAKWFGSRHVVVAVEDLHCHPEVQKNIASVLRALDGKYRLKKVHVEGAVGPVDTSMLAGIKNDDLKKRISESLLRQGKLTGAEYYSIVSGKPLLLSGLEQRDLYVGNIVRLGEIFDSRPAVDALLRDFHDRAGDLKMYYYSRESRKLDAIAGKNRKGGLPPVKYYTLLGKYCARYDVDVKRYENICRHVALAARGRTIDYPAVAGELSSFLSVLRQTLPFPAYEQLRRETDNFSRCDESVVRLAQLSADGGLHMSARFPRLAAFFAYMSETRKMNPRKLLVEEKRLVAELRARLARNACEREVAFIADYVDRLDDYLHAEASADDCDFVAANFFQFKLLWTKYTPSDKLADLERHMRLLDEYYRANRERNVCFLNALSIGGAAGGAPRVCRDDAAEVLRSLDEHADVIVTVAGGFHTPGFTRLLADRRISYLVITPQVTEETGPAERAYASIIAQQAKLLASAMVPLTLFQNPEAVRVQGMTEQLLNAETGDIVARQEAIGGQLRESIPGVAAFSVARRQAGVYAVAIGGAGKAYHFIYYRQAGTLVSPETPPASGERNISLLNRAAMAAFVSAAGGVIGTAVFGTPLGWLIGAIMSCHFIRQAYYIAKTGLELGPPSLGPTAKIWYVASHLDRFIPARVVNGAVTLDDPTFFRLPPWLREQVCRHEQLHLEFRRRHPGTARIPVIEEIAVSLRELNPAGYLAGAAKTLRSIRMREMRLLKYALLLPVTGIPGPGTGNIAGNGKENRGYDDAILGYYSARKGLLEAITARNPHRYRAEHERLMRSAEQVRDAAARDALDLETVFERMRGAGRFDGMSLINGNGVPVLGPWDEMLHAAGEEFSDEHRRWIAESVDSLVKAFPAKQRRFVEAVAPQIIENTFPYSAAQCLPSPEEMEELLSGTKDFDALLALAASISDELATAANYRSQFNYGFNVSYRKEPKIVMHATGERDIFCAVYAHEVLHYLARTGKIGIPHNMEVLNHAVMSTEFAGSKTIGTTAEGWRNALPALGVWHGFFEAGRKWSEENPGKELSVDELSLLTFAACVRDWEALKIPSLEAALSIPRLLKTGQFDIGLFQRWAGTALGGVMWEQSGENAPAALRRSIEWADQVLARETENAARFAPDTARRQRIADRIAGLLRVLTGNGDLQLVARESDGNGKRSAFGLSDDRAAVEYDPAVLDHPDGEIAEALFLEQVFPLLLSNSGWVEPGHRNAFFMSLFATVELLRTRRLGIGASDSLRRMFNKLDGELYPNPESESAKRRMRELPLFVQYLEGILYEGRTGRPDPRISDSRVKKAINTTRRARAQLHAQDTVRESYRITRDQLWPALKNIVEKAQEEQLRQDALARRAAEERGMDVSNLSKRGQKRLQQLAEKQWESMGDDERQEFTDKLQQSIRETLEGYLGKLGGSPQAGEALAQSSKESQAERNAARGRRVGSALRQADALRQGIAEIDALLDRAQGAAGDLEAKAGELRDRTGAAPIGGADALELRDLVSRIRKEAGNLMRDTQSFKSSTARLHDCCRKNREKDQAAAKDSAGSADTLDRKAGGLAGDARAFDRTVDELDGKMKHLPETVDRRKDTPTQRAAASEAHKDAEEISRDIEAMKDAVREMRGLLDAVRRELDEAMRDMQQEGEADGQKPAAGGRDQGQGDRREPGKEQRGHADPVPTPLSDKSREILKKLMEQRAGAPGEQTPQYQWGAALQDASASIRDGKATAAELTAMNNVLNPLKAAAATLRQQIQRNLQQTMLDRDMTGLSEGDLSDDFTTYRIGNVFQRKLLPGRVSHRIVIVVDTSGSMGSAASAGSNMYHAVRAAMIILLALQGIRGVEIGVMMYGDTPSRQLLPLTKAVALTDLHIYRMYKKLSESGGSTEDMPTLDTVAGLIADGADAATLKTVLHIGDGNPDNRQLRRQVTALYLRHAKKHILWTSWGVGPGAEKMRRDYSPDETVQRSIPPAFWPKAAHVPDAGQLSGKSSAFVAALFKEKRPVVGLGNDIPVVLNHALAGAIPPAAFLQDECLRILGVQSAGGITRGLIAELMRESAGIAARLLLTVLKGKTEHWLLPETEARNKYGAALGALENEFGARIRVSRAPLDLLVPRRDAFVFASTEPDPATGAPTVIVHESVLNAAGADGALRRSAVEHEIEEYRFTAMAAAAAATGDFSALADAWPALAGEDRAFIAENPGRAYEVFHKLTEQKYARLFALAREIAGRQKHVTQLGYVRKDGKAYLRLKTPAMVYPVEVEVREGYASRKVKLYVKKNAAWKSVNPGEDIVTVPDEIGFSVKRGAQEGIRAFKFTEDNVRTLAEMLKTYANPVAKNSNVGLIGPRGSGKNTLAFVAAALLGIPMREMSLHAHITQNDLRERKTIDHEGELAVAAEVPGAEKPVTVRLPADRIKSLPSEVYEAAKLGELVIIDEIDKVLIPGHLSGLNAVLSRIHEKLDGIEDIHPHFRVMALMNSHEGGDVQGQDLSVSAADFIDRFSWIDAGYMSPESELDYVMSTVFGDAKDEQERAAAEEVMRRVISIATRIRTAVRLGQLPRNLSTRGVLRIARHYRFYPNDVLEHFRSLFEKSYRSDALEGDHELIDGIIESCGMLNARYPVGRAPGAEFEYFTDHGAVYCRLGEVTVRTPIPPAKMDMVRAGLKTEWHVPSNMRMFSEWMKDVALGNNIMVLGVTGTGKTELMNYLLKDVLGMSPRYQLLTATTRGDDLFGTWDMQMNRFSFKKSECARAMEEGVPCILDEIDKPQDETTLSALNNVGEFGQVTLPDRSVIDAAGGFFYVMTGNLSWKGGTSSQRISGEVADRCSAYVLQPLPLEEFVEILQRYAGKNAYPLDPAYLEALAKFHYALSGETDRGNLPRTPSMRALEKVIDYVGRHPEGYYRVLPIYLRNYHLSSEWHRDIVRKQFEESGLEELSLRRWVAAVSRACGSELEEALCDRLIGLKNELDREAGAQKLPHSLTEEGFKAIVETLAREQGRLYWEEERYDRDGPGSRLVTVVDVVAAQLDLEPGHEELVRNICLDRFPELDFADRVSRHNDEVQDRLAEVQEIARQLRTDDSFVDEVAKKMVKRAHALLKKVGAAARESQEIARKKSSLRLGDIARAADLAQQAAAAAEEAQAIAQTARKNGIGRVADMSLSSSSLVALIEKIVGYGRGLLTEDDAQGPAEAAPEHAQDPDAPENLDALRLHLLRYVHAVVGETVARLSRYGSESESYEAQYSRHLETLVQTFLQYVVEAAINGSQTTRSGAPAKNPSVPQAVLDAFRAIGIDCDALREEIRLRRSKRVAYAEPSSPAWQGAAGERLMLPGEIYGIARSRDGSCFAVSYYEGEKACVQIFGAERKAVRTIEGAALEGNDPFSADGRRIIVFNEASGQFMMVDVVSGRIVRRFAAASRRGSACISPGNHYVAACGDGVRIWNGTTGSLLHSLPTEGMQSPVEAVGFTADEKYVVTRSYESIGIRGVASGKEVKRIDGYRFPDACLTADGSRIVACTDKGMVILWDVPTGRMVSFFEIRDDLRKICLSTNGVMAAVRGAKSVYLLNILTGKTTAVPAADNGAAITSLAFDAAHGFDGDFLVCGGTDKSLRFYEIGYEGEGIGAASSVQTAFQPIRGLLARLDGVKNLAVPGLAVAVRGAFAAAGHAPAAEETTGRIVDIQPEKIRDENGEEKDVLRCRGTIHSIAYSSDGALLATVYGSFSRNEYEIDVRNRSTGAIAARIRERRDVKTLLFSRDDRELVCLDNDGAIVIRDMVSGEIVKTYRVKNDKPGSDRKPVIREICLTPDGRHIVAGYDNGTVGFIDYATGKDARESFAMGADKPVTCVAVSGDGRYFAAGNGAGGDNEVCVWDYATGRKVLRYGAHGGHVTKLAFTPGGKYIVSASLDKIKKVDIGSWNTVFEVDPRATAAEMIGVDEDDRIRASLQDMVMTPDGRYIISSNGYDLTLFVWDAANGNLDRFVPNGAKGSRSLALSPDGAHLACAADDYSLFPRLIYSWQITLKRETGPRKSPKEDAAPLFLAGLTDLLGRILSSKTGDLAGRTVIGLKPSSLKGSGGEEADCLAFDKKIQAIVPSQDGARCALVTVDYHTDDFTVDIRNRQSGETIDRRDGKAFLGMITVTSDCKYLLWANTDGTGKVHVWQYDREKPEQTGYLRRISGSAHAVSETPDNRHILIGFSPSEVYFPGKPDTVQIWDRETRQHVGDLEGCGVTIFALGVSANGKYVVAAGQDVMRKNAELVVWNFETRQEVCRIECGNVFVGSAAVTNDAKYVFFGTDEGRIHVIDTAAEKIVSTVENAHKGRVSALALIGRNLYSGGFDGKVRPWEVAVADGDAGIVKSDSLKIAGGSRFYCGDSMRDGLRVEIRDRRECRQFGQLLLDGGHAREETTVIQDRSFRVIIENGIGVTGGEIGSLLREALDRSGGNIDALPQTLVIAFLDRSTHLFEDHLANGFIGVNRALDTIDRDAARKATLCAGLFHELCHEATGRQGAAFENEQFGRDVSYVAELLKDYDVPVDEFASAFSRDIEPDLLVEGLQARMPVPSRGECPHLKMRNDSRYYSDVPVKGGEEISIGSSRDAKKLASALTHQRLKLRVRERGTVTVLMERGIDMPSYSLQGLLDELSGEAGDRPWPDTIVLALLDASPHLFEDHLANGFIGINRSLIEEVGRKSSLVKDVLLLAGVRHELAHELTGRSGAEFEQRQFLSDAAYLFGLLQWFRILAQFAVIAPGIFATTALSGAIGMYLHPLVASIANATRATPPAIAEALVEKGVDRRHLTGGRVPLKTVLRIFAGERIRRELTGGGIRRTWDRLYVCQSSFGRSQGVIDRISVVFPLGYGVMERHYRQITFRREGNSRDWLIDDELLAAKDRMFFNGPKKLLQCLPEIDDEDGVINEVKAPETGTRTAPSLPPGKALMENPLVHTVAKASGMPADYVAILFLKRNIEPDELLNNRIPLMKVLTAFRYDSWMLLGAGPDGNESFNIHDSYSENNARGRLRKISVRFVNQLYGGVWEIALLKDPRSPQWFVGEARQVPELDDERAVPQGPSHLEDCLRQCSGSDYIGLMVPAADGEDRTKGRKVISIDEMRSKKPKGAWFANPFYERYVAWWLEAPLSLAAGCAASLAVPAELRDGLSVVCCAIAFWLPHAVFRGKELAFSSAILSLTAGTVLAGMPLFLFGMSNPGAVVAAAAIMTALSVAHFFFNRGRSVETMPGVYRQPAGDTAVAAASNDAAESRQNGETGISGTGTAPEEKPRLSWQGIERYKKTIVRELEGRGITINRDAEPAGDGEAGNSPDFAVAGDHRDGVSAFIAVLRRNGDRGILSDAFIRETADAFLPHNAEDEFRGQVRQLGAAVSAEDAGGKEKGFLLFERLGLPYPPGIVLPEHVVTAFLEADNSGKEQYVRFIRAAMERAGIDVGSSGHVAVRSDPLYPMPGILPAVPRTLDVRGSIEAVAASWMSDNAKGYRRKAAVSDVLGMSVIIQKWIHPKGAGAKRGKKKAGNEVLLFAAGVVSTRNPNTGSDELYGHYVENDVWDGETARGKGVEDIRQLQTAGGKIYLELLHAKKMLEAATGYPQELEFVVNNGMLFFLQVSPVTFAPQAEIAYIDAQQRQGNMTRERARTLRRQIRERLGERKLCAVRRDARVELLASGAAAAVPGALQGYVAWNGDRARHLMNKGLPVVFVLDQKNREELLPLALGYPAAALITTYGSGSSREAALLRGAGIPSLINLRQAQWEKGREAVALKGGNVIREGDFVTVDGNRNLLFVNYDDILEETHPAGAVSGGNRRGDASWLDDDLYRLYAAAWLETYIAYFSGKAACLLLRQAVGDDLVAAALAGGVAGLVFWLPHFAFRGREAANKSYVQLLAHATAFFCFIEYAVASAVPVSCLIYAHWIVNLSDEEEISGWLDGTVRRAKTWFASCVAVKNNIAAFVRKTGGKLAAKTGAGRKPGEDERMNSARSLAPAVSPLENSAERLKTFDPRRIVSGEAVAGAFDPQERGEFERKYPMLSGKTLITFCLDLEAADIEASLRLAEKGFVNTLLVSRMTGEMPVQDGDGAVIFMETGRAKEYAQARGTLTWLFDVPLGVRGRNGPARVAIWAMRYSRNGVSTIGLFAEPRDAFSDIAGITNPEVSLEEKDIVALRQVFLGAVRRIAEDAQTVQPKLFALGLPVKRVAPAVLAMKDAAVLLSPAVFDDGGRAEWKDVVLAFMPGKGGRTALPPAGAAQGGPDKRHEQMADGGSRIDVNMTGRKCDVVIDGNEAPEDVFARYELAVIVKNAECVAGAQSNMISRVNDMRRLLPVPFDAALSVGKITHLPQRIKELKQMGVDTVLIAPFDAADPFAVDRDIIDESDAIREYPELEAFKPRADEGDGGRIAMDRFESQSRRFWQEAGRRARADEEGRRRVGEFRKRNAAFQERGLSDGAALAQMHGQKELLMAAAFAHGSGIKGKLHVEFPFNEDMRAARTFEAVAYWIRQKVDRRFAFDGVRLDFGPLQRLPDGFENFLRDARSVNPEIVVSVVGPADVPGKDMLRLSKTLGFDLVVRHVVGNEQTPPFAVEDGGVTVEIMPAGELVADREQAARERLLENLKKMCRNARAVVVPDDLLADGVAADDAGRRYLLPVERTESDSYVRELLKVLGIEPVNTPEERGYRTALNIDENYVPCKGEWTLETARAFYAIFDRNGAAATGASFIDDTTAIVRKISWLNERNWPAGWQQMEKMKRLAENAAPDALPGCHRELAGFLRGTMERALEKSVTRKRPFAGAYDRKALRRLLFNADRLIIAGSGTGESCGSIDRMVELLLAAGRYDSAVFTPHDKVDVRKRLQDTVALADTPELLLRYAALLEEGGTGPEDRALLNRYADMLRQDEGILASSPVAVAGLLRLFDIIADRREQLPSGAALQDAVGSASIEAVNAIRGAG